MKQNTGLKSIMLSCYINVNDPPNGILTYFSVVYCQKTHFNIYKEASVSIFVQMFVPVYWHDPK